MYAIGCADRTCIACARKCSTSLAEPVEVEEGGRLHSVSPTTARLLRDGAAVLAG
jgi:hypothetical protein